MVTRVRSPQASRLGARRRSSPRRDDGAVGREPARQVAIGAGKARSGGRPPSPFRGAGERVAQSPRRCGSSAEDTLPASVGSLSPTATVTVMNLSSLVSSLINNVSLVRIATGKVNKMSTDPSNARQNILTLHLQNASKIHPSCRHISILGSGSGKDFRSPYAANCAPPRLGAAGAATPGPVGETGKAQTSVTTARVARERLKRLCPGRRWGRVFDVRQNSYG
jgi:hypothetical protein